MLINTQILKGMVNKLNYCTGDETLNSSLSHVCFDNNKIYTFNGIESIVINYPIGIECVVKADLLLKFINSIPFETIDLSLDINNKLIIKSGKFKNIITTLPKSSFIINTFPESSSAVKIEVDNDFIQGIKKCVLTSRNDISKIAQYGVTFVNNCLYSTDNKRMSRYKLLKDYALNNKILLPLSFCNLLIKLGDSIDKPLLIVSDNYICCKLNNLTLYTALLSGVNFIDFDKYMSLYDDERVLCSSNELLPIIERCSNSLTKQDDSVVTLNLKDGVLYSKIMGKLCQYDESLNVSDMSNLSGFNLELDLFLSLLKNTDLIGFFKTESTVIVKGKRGNYTQLLNSKYLLQTI